MIQKIVFGAGCFWHVEEAFRKLKGVKKTLVGYMGGSLKNPSYEEICNNNTGHVEVCLVKFDSNIISLEKLFNVFWKIHDPTQLNRQGSDVGEQYRSVVFYYSGDQKVFVEESLKNEQKRYDKKIVTEVIKADTFFEAEKYHQKYLMKRGKNTC